jgi:hypothetical protein
MIPDTLYIEATQPSDRVHLHGRFWSAILVCNFAVYGLAIAQKIGVLLDIMIHFMLRLLSLVTGFIYTVDFGV